MLAQTVLAVLATASTDVWPSLRSDQGTPTCGRVGAWPCRKRRTFGRSLCCSGQREQLSFGSGPGHLPAPAAALARASRPERRTLEERFPSECRRRVLARRQPFVAEHVTCLACATLFVARRTFADAGRIGREVRAKTKFAPHAPEQEAGPRPGGLGGGTDLDPARGSNPVSGLRRQLKKLRKVPSGPQPGEICPTAAPLLR